MKHNWNHIKFGDAFNLQMGKTPARANGAYWSDGLYDWVSISDMPNGKYIRGTKEKISQKAVDETGIHLVKKGTALMSFKLTIGKTAIAPYDLYTNEAIMAFEPKEGIDVLSDFLYYYLQLYKWEGNRAVMGNTTNKGVIANSYAYIPSLDEQQSIVRELDGINHLIDLQEEQLREYDRLAQSLFYSTFGDPATNPKGWEVKKLGKVVDVLNGFAFKSSKYVKDGIRVIRIANVQKGKIVDEAPVFYPSFEEQELTRYMLHEDDILLSLTGNVGRVGLLPKEMLPAALNQRVACLRIKDDALLFKFLYQFLNSDYFEQKCIESSRGIAQLNMSTEWLKEYHIPLPPLVLQQTFAAQIVAIEQQKALVRKSLEETRTLLAARMQYYFE